MPSSASDMEKPMKSVNNPRFFGISGILRISPESAVPVENIWDNSNSVGFECAIKILDPI